MIEKIACVVFDRIFALFAMQLSESEFSKLLN